MLVILTRRLKKKEGVGWNIRFQFYFYSNIGEKWPRKAFNSTSRIINTLIGTVTDVLCIGSDSRRYFHIANSYQLHYLWGGGGEHWMLVVWTYNCTANSTFNDRAWKGVFYLSQNRPHIHCLHLEIWTMKDNYINAITNATDITVRSSAIDGTIQQYF